MNNFKITKTILENINEQNDRINECVDIVNGYTTDEETRVNQELQRQENELRREEQYNNNENRFAEINQQLDNIAIQVTPRMTNNNLQEAVDLAVTLGVNKLVLEKKTYNLNDTLYLPSNFILEGVKGESIISMQGINKPVISKKGSIGGNTHIKNITIIGDKTQSENDGIYFNDYYSSIEDCTIGNCGRYGVYFANGAASGTLVENKFKSLVFRNCMGYAFYSDDGNKCTDATLEDILVNGATGVLGGIRIGSGAGWFISKVHTYNFNSVCPFDIRNSYNTNIDNIYIENSGSEAIGLYQVQQTCNINNITIMRSTNMRTGIYLNKSTTTSYSAVVNISNCNIVNNIDSDFTMINSDGSSVGVKTSNLSIQGTNKSSVKLIGDNIKSSSSYIDNVQIDGTLRGENSKLFLNDTKFLPYFTKKWSGKGEKTIVLQLSNITPYCKIPFLITLFAQKWDTQGGQVKFSASGLISCGSSVSSNAIMSLELGTSIGLTTTPKYSLNGETQELTIKFTPSATDASNQGILYIQFGY